MSTAKIIIGANFGDEGKGRAVDYFAHVSPNPIVIRHNGGPQAGHTVVDKRDFFLSRRHVFSHFGAGTLRGAPTFLSRFFTVNPILFNKELNQLKTKRVTPYVYVDANAPLTTPYDILLNQFFEHQRGNKRHGSCGVGINETITRNTNNQYPTYVRDMADLVHLDAKLDHIWFDYLYKRVISLGYDFTDLSLWMQAQDLSHKAIKLNYVIQCNDFLHRARVVEDTTVLKDYSTLIFEGAQGLLLDENHYWFPNVTRSKTGITNAVSILKELEIEKANVHYITRPYLTRHGAGPLPFEGDKPFPGIIDNTNVTNDHQGSLRFAPINIDLLKESITNDLKQSGGLDITPHLIITCVDQLHGGLEIDQVFDYPYVENGVVERCQAGLLLEKIISAYKFDTTLLSYAAEIDNLDLNVQSRSTPINTPT